MKTKKNKNVLLIDWEKEDEKWVDAYLIAENLTSHLVHIGCIEKSIEYITEEDTDKLCEKRHRWYEDFIDFIGSFRPRKVIYQGDN